MYCAYLNAVYSLGTVTRLRAAGSAAQRRRSDIPTVSRLSLCRRGHPRSSRPVEGCEYFSSYVTGAGGGTATNADALERCSGQWPSMNDASASSADTHDLREPEPARRSVTGREALAAPGVRDLANSIFKL
jgi:hypothetical protein